MLVWITLEVLESSYIAGVIVKWCNHFGKQFAVSSQPVKIELPWAQQFHSLIYIKRLENKRPLKSLYKNIHSNVINNGWKVKTIQMSINWGLDKQNVVYPDNRILFCNKNNKEISKYTYYSYNMDELKNMVISERVNYKAIHCIIPFIWNIPK